MSLTMAQEWLLSKRQDSSRKSIQLENVQVHTRRSFVISVTSGKGGVGKTTLALKLAQQFNELGKRVLLIDSDVNLSNTLVKLGLPLSDGYFDLITAKKTFEEIIIHHRGVDILPGCNGNWDLYSHESQHHEYLLDIITAHRDKYDFVIIDSPAGLAPVTLNLNAYSDYRFVVVTPDSSSLTDSYSLIKILSQRFDIKENHLIVNQVRSQGQYLKVVKGLCDTVDRFLGSRLKVLGSISDFDLMLDQIDRNVLQRQNLPISKQFLKLIEHFTEEHSAAFCMESSPGSTQVKKAEWSQQEVSQHS